jgi:dihydroorotate dehydrogenase
LDIYRAGIRPLLFSGLKADPEWLHGQTIQVLNWLSRPEANDFVAPSAIAPATSIRPSLLPWVNRQLQQSLCLSDPRLEQTLWDIYFPNPVGLAAGFDKDGLAAGAWSSLGFGFAELGTVTLHPQPGNPRPRLFRLPIDRAALNRMGFNNQGAAAMVSRLGATRLGATRSGSESKTFSIPLGINLGKSKITPLEEAAADYLGSFRLLKDWGDYFVVNVSSPNTPGLRSLQATDQLEPILQALQQENQGNQPILVKIAPDLEWEAIAAVLQLAQAYNLAGIIATNTTISRDGLKTQVIDVTGNSVQDEAGGISGAPLRQRATDVIRFIYRETDGKLPIVGVGGIFTAEDAWEKITAGASLVQIYTGWIYEGPWMVRRILEGLLKKLAAQGMANLTEAIGTEP